ncbi:hypothetical protein IHV10_06400 [Fictibacillus sp. 5RED26]|uniref:DUF5659 domain-containing protein n=1 Tax=Fictibacillus sp. 5RED26 TaxID=2745876 RepID=UPI0018CDE914|nr:DUF5659 domain-containing protein [Fictibacillus sp. 5RED26]MBH0155993.1 hypothetical protein [Fictibacillus sp. 5RED26]
MENVSEKDFVVFSQRMAGYLMMNSCRLKKMKVDKDNSTKFVYFFTDNQNVRKLAAQYKFINK